MNQQAKIQQGINNLITNLRPSTSQSKREEIQSFCKRLFGAVYNKSTSQSAQQIKDKIINNVSSWSDNKTVLQCQQTINKIMTSSVIQKKTQLLKVLLKISEHNNQGKNFSNIFNNDSKVQTLNQTQQTINNLSYSNQNQNNVFLRNKRTTSEQKRQPLRKTRGTLDEKISQTQILSQISYILQNIDTTLFKLDQESESYLLQPNVQVNEAVRNIVNDLCQIGYLFKKMVGSISDKGTIQKSLYLAVQQELTQYFRWLAVMENTIRENKLTLIKLKLWQFRPLQKMKWLNMILQSVQNYRGCQIISVINSFRPQGQSSVNQLLNRLLSHLVKPLLHFIHNWIYKGQLIDENKQFFVQQKSKVNQIMEWYQKYNLVQRNIPNILDKQSAIMIYNAGKTTYFLKNRCKCNYSLVIPFINHSQILNKDIYESSNILSTDFKKWLTSVYEELSKKLVNQLKQKFNLNYHLQSMKHFYLMGKGDFIQHLIDTLKDVMGTAKHLIYQHTLDGYISDALTKSFQDFRIDIKPEQIQVFKEKQKMRIQEGSQKNNVLKKSKISFRNKKQINFDNSFRANIIDRLLAKKVDFGQNTSWDSFNFQYSLQKIQPLYSILTPELMKNYQKIFQFLWKIKRTQQVLKQIWMIEQKDYPKNLKTKIIPHLGTILHKSHTLRSNMSHFFNNFYGYLMIGIESAWNKFSSSVEKAESLDQIIVEHQKLHDELCKITFALPNKKSLLDTLTNVLKSIQNLKVFETQLLNTYSRNTELYKVYENRRKIAAKKILQNIEEYTLPQVNQEEIFARIQEISNLYNTNFKKFYQNLKREGQETNVLVFRLDFSQFFATQEIQRKY